MEDAIKVIDKHIENHDEIVRETMFYLKILKFLGNDDEDNEIKEEMANDIMSHVSAIAALKMVKSELNGEKEY